MTMYLPIRLWIVEDNPQYRQTMVQLVGFTDGMECLQDFERGEEVLAAAAVPGVTPPNVVLMDISLPGLSGIATTERLKSQWPAVQIVMLTNHDEADFVFSALRSGASGYLLKNMPVDHILTAIRQASRGAMLLTAPVARKVQRFFSDQASAGADYGLSPREQEVLQQMVEGLSQKEIAEVLFISRSTVNSHIQRIYEKLHVNSASAAVAKAVRECLV